MERVKDTASFIRRARQVHGDTYDYSLAKYTASQQPITLICRVCGPFVLSQAGTHYRKRKPCGCGKCNYGVYAGRKYCDCGLPIDAHNKRIHAESNTCRTCYSRDRDAREFERRKRACKNCGEWYFRRSNNHTTCGPCKERRKRKRASSFVSCRTCGKRFSRCSQKRGRNKHHFCSLGCYEKRATKKKLQLPIVVLYKCECCGTVSHGRRCNTDGCWAHAIRKASVEAIAKQKSRTKKRTKKQEWAYRITLRLNSNRHRDTKQAPPEPKGYNAIGALKHLERRIAWHQQDAWKKKLGGKLSGMAQRQRRKQKQRRSGVRKAQKKPVQMCFKWN